MATTPEPTPDLRLEIAYVLLIDIVGYSNVLVNEQIEVVQTLNQIVRGTHQFQTAEEAGKLIRLPTGDGMALLFFTGPEAPLRCALEISQELRNHPKLKVRMGAHSGPVNEVLDVNDRPNMAGVALNIAQRVMDCGDAEHILLSKHLAEDLAQYRHWQPYLHDLGEVEVKHGLRLHLVNLCKEDLGNRRVPSKLKRKHWRPNLSAAEAQNVHALPRRRPLSSFLLLFGAVVAIAAIITSVLIHRGQTEKNQAPKSESQTAIGSSEKKIAILPFHPLGADPESVRLAEGIHDQLLTTLARNKDLTVISQVSVLDPRLSSMTTSAKGQALGVGTLMEGSLDRNGSNFRVNARLVEAHSGKTFYARTYEGKETNLFELQTRIADDMATQLQAPRENLAESVPTENLAAYELFLRGREWESRPENEVGVNALKAAQCYEQALALDPNFALAEVRLAYTYARLYWQEDDWSARPGHLAKARHAVEDALRLQPELPEAHAALGYYYYYGHRDYDHALQEFKIAQTDLPNDSEITVAVGLVQRRKALWNDALSNLIRATQLDPLNARFLTLLADTYEGLRRYDEAQQTIGRVLALAPGTPDVLLQQAYVRFKVSGSTSELRQAVSSIDPTQESDTAGYARFDVNMLEHKYDDAIASLEKSHLAKFETEWAIFPKELLCALACLAKGNLARARPYFEASRLFMEPVVQTNTEGPRLRIALALAYAGLGRKVEALQQGTLARDERSISIDAVAGPPIAAMLARIYTMVGEKDLAVRELDPLLSVPFGLTTNHLRYDPSWDGLRAESSFKRLLKNAK